MGPTHGWWCNAVTWRTKCPGCREPVYFFQCDCGSKVFFDDLGDPWPIHDCETSWTRNLIRSRDEHGGITVELSEGVSVRRSPERFTVEPDVLSRARRREKKEQPDPIVAVPPEGAAGAITVIGILREKRTKVDPVKALKLPGESSMVAAFLGPLAAGEWGKVTVHEPSASRNVRHSYTAWARSDDIAHGRSMRGVTVWMDLAPLDLPGIGSVWVCENYEVMG